MTVALGPGIPHILRIYIQDALQFVTIIVVIRVPHFTGWIEEVSLYFRDGIPFYGEWPTLEKVSHDICRRSNRDCPESFLRSLDFPSLPQYTSLCPQISQPFSVFLNHLSRFHARVFFCFIQIHVFDHGFAVDGVKFSYRIELLSSGLSVIFLRQ